MYKPNKMQIFRKGSTTIPVLVISLSILVVGAMSYYAIKVAHLSSGSHSTTTTSASATSTIPAEIITKADAFIIKNVGEKYFHENYHRAPSKDTVSKDNIEYRVGYEFTPASSISGSPYFSEVQYYPSTDVTRGTSIYDCIATPIYCTFTVDKKQAATIAKQHGIDTKKKFTSSFSGVDMPQWVSGTARSGWYWNFSQIISQHDDCEKYHGLEINASTGAVGPLTTGEQCGIETM